MSNCSPELLQQVPLFSVLTLEQCTQLLDRHIATRHSPEQVFVMEQDWGESLFLLREGMAKVRSYTSDGEEVVMSVLGAGDIFGEMAALEGTSRSADVVALTAVSVVKLRSAPFANLLQENAGFALALARLEASRLRDLNQRFAIHSSDATTRLLDALAYLARKSTVDNNPQAVIPDLAQREIGILAGLARETASRTLSKLRSKKIVEDQPEGLKIIDLQPLVKRGLLPVSAARK